MIEEFDMKLLQEYSRKYFNSSKAQKSKILDEYMSLCHLTKRNTAVKRFERFRYSSNNGRQFIKKPGRPKKYGSLEIEILKTIYYMSDFICAERLYPVLRLFVSQLEANDKDFKFKYPADVVERVLNISLGSLKRIISGFEKPKKKRCHLSNSMLWKDIPVVANSYHKYTDDITASACDLVEHKGENSSGIYAITYVNVHFYSQWITRISALGKDRTAIEEIYSKLLSSNPLYKYGIVKKSHQDNEKALLSYLYHKTNLELSRSRAYKSNVTHLVEQKNGDKVRNIVGRFRYDTDWEVELLNKIWEISDLIDNFFIPSHKIISRIKDDKGRTVKKIYDTPKTPYQRLMESKDMPDEIKKELTMTFNSLNLVDLRKKQIELRNELMWFKKRKRLALKNYQVELVA